MFITRKLVCVIFLATILTLGCQGKKISLTPHSDSDYKSRSVKYNIKIGVFLSDKTRNYIMPVGIGVNKISIGECLEEEAITSLGKIFPPVILISDKNKVPPNVERIIIIEFGKETDVELRTKKWLPLIVKEFAGRIKLQYKVYDKNWNLYQDGIAIGSSAEEIKVSGGYGGGAAGGFRAGSAGSYELEKAVGDSLLIALEEINDQIIKSEKKLGLVNP